MAFVIGDTEIEALQGQAHMNYCIYLYIRRFMDYATGVVGLKRGISYQSISEAVYIEPRAGVKGGSPHKSSIRRALDQLIKSGLIERFGCPDNLVFKMPFAYADNNARKKADIKPTPHNDTPKRPQNKAFEGVRSGKSKKL